MRCPNCGFDNQDEAAVCAHCGEPLTHTVMRPVRQENHLDKPPIDLDDYLFSDNGAHINHYDNSRDAHVPDEALKNQVHGPNRTLIAVLIIVAVIGALVLVIKNSDFSQQGQKTYNVIGNLSFKPSAYKVEKDAWGDFNYSIKANKIKNSAYSEVPKGVKAKDWHRLLNAISYKPDDEPGNRVYIAKDVSQKKIEVQYHQALNTDAARAFTRKYHCRLQTDKNHSTSKTVLFRAKNVFLSQKQVETNRKDLIKAVEDESAYKVNKMMEEYGNLRGPLTNRELYFIRSKSSPDTYLMCGYDYDTSNEFSAAHTYYYAIYGPLAGGITSDEIIDESFNVKTDYTSIDNSGWRNKFREEMAHGDILDNYRGTMTKMTY